MKVMTSDRNQVGFEIRNSSPPNTTMTFAQSTGREKWIVLGMLWVVCLLNYADRQAISSLFP
jgi:hypothetical protein